MLFIAQAFVLAFLPIVLANFRAGLWDPIDYRQAIASQLMMSLIARSSPDATTLVSRR